jgi:hypothetical protein
VRVLTAGSLKIECVIIIFLYRWNDELKGKIGYGKGRLGYPKQDLVGLLNQRVSLGKLFIGTNTHFRVEIFSRKIG